MSSVRNRHRVAVVLSTASVATLFSGAVQLAVGADVNLTVGSRTTAKAISPYIYGTNFNAFGNQLTTRSAATSERMGGNRWTAYNWENNYSNAGSDYLYQNDTYLSNSTTPGKPVLDNINATTTGGTNGKQQALIVTVPTAGWVSADKNGPVATADYATYNPALYSGTRFVQSYPAKPASAGAFTLTPNLTDHAVYQDEFVNWVQTKAGAGRTAPIMYQLDNEPDLWNSTHAEIRRDPTTGNAVPTSYAEIITRSTQYATAIKNVAPSAVVLGPVNYGWQGMRAFQDATDGAGRNFQQYYLAQMKIAGTAAGKRLLDVDDVHWYPEATGLSAGGQAVRIVDSAGVVSSDPGVIAARVQATRSLWDTTYVETSWITQYSTGGQAIRLLPRMQSDINTYYPGTKIGMTEYAYGGGNQISGATAQADALGIYGAQGVYAANLWNVQADNTFTLAAFDMFLNYDGAGHGFGDTSFTASASDASKASIYASVSSTDPTKVIIVEINKTGGTLSTLADLSALGPGFTHMTQYQLAGTSATPTLVSDINLSGSASLPLSLLPYSVNTIALTIAPYTWTGASGDRLWATAGNWNGASPTGAGIGAILGTAPTVPTTITLNTAITLGSLQFTNANAYTLSGSGSITLQGISTSALVQVDQGSHAINVPVTLASLVTTANIANGSSLAMTQILGTGKSINKTGGGTLRVDSLTAQTLNVQVGKVQLKTATPHVASTSVLGTLLVANDAAPLGSRTYTATLDIGNSDLIVRSGSLADISDMARAGQNGATLFAGTGLTSSTAASDAAGALRYAVGVVQNNIGGTALYTTFDGVTVGANDILVKFTYFGDADLNGVVDDTDFFLINNGYGGNLTGWINGDFDYSGTVDDTDYFLINNAYTSQGAGLRAGDSIPEPTAALVPALLLLTAGTLRTRNRHA